MGDLLETIELETGTNPAAAVIWMHGRAPMATISWPSSTNSIYPLHRRYALCSHMPR